MFKIGVDVYCTDTQIGKLIKVAIDPHSKRVTDLIIAKGLLLKKDRVIPTDTVTKADEAQIHLGIHSHEITNYPIYREVEFTTSDPNVLQEMGYQPDQSVQWALRYGIATAGMDVVSPRLRERIHEGVGADKPVIGRNTRIQNADGTVGFVNHLLANKEGEITYIVMRRGLLPFRAVIPMSMVKDIDDERIYIQASRQELQALEKFTPRADRDILGEIQQKLSEYFDWDLSHITVSLVDGVARLTGSVANIFGKRAAHQIAENVKGVLGVEDEIITDTEVEARVASALLADPRTYLAVIEAKVEDGVVTLTGTVDSEVGKASAEEITAVQPGVLKVINKLDVAAETKHQASEMQNQ